MPTEVYQPYTATASHPLPPTSVNSTYMIIVSYTPFTCFSLPPLITISIPNPDTSASQIKSSFVR